MPYANSQARRAHHPISSQELIASFSHEMLQWHASPIEVAQFARDAGVGRVVFSRIYPPANSMIERWAFLRGVRAVFPNVVGFSELPPPSELIFQLGIAFPQRARIKRQRFRGQTERHGAGNAGAAC